MKTKLVTLADWLWALLVLELSLAFLWICTLWMDWLSTPHRFRPWRPAAPDMSAYPPAEPPLPYDDLIAVGVWWAIMAFVMWMCCFLYWVFGGFDGD